MWCAQCMQDVPVLPHGSTARCSRCQAVLTPGEHAPNVLPGREPAPKTDAPPDLLLVSPEQLRHELENLELELLHTRCELETIQAILHAEPEDWQWLWASEGYLRWDAQNVAVRGPRRRQPAPSKPASQQQPPAPANTATQGAARFLGELLIYLAAMFFSLGGVLAAWAHWGGREQFWSIAWPALAASAAGLLLGVLLRAWAGPPPSVSQELASPPQPQAPGTKPLGSHRADQPSLRFSGPHWSPAVEAITGLRWEQEAAGADPPVGTSR